MIAGLVRDAVEQSVPLAEVAVPALGDEAAAVLSQSSWLESKESEGGTALARVREQLERLRAAAVKAGVLRPPGPRRRPRPRRLRGAPRRHRGAHRRDRGLPPHRGRLPRLRRPDRAHLDALRAAGHGLRVPLLRHPRPAQRRLRARGRRRRGADPRARAARRRRADARAPARRPRRRPLQRPGQAHAGARASSSTSTRRRSSTARSRSSRATGAAPELVVGTRIGITRAVELPVALLRARQPPRLAPWVPGGRRPRGWAARSRRRWCSSRPCPELGGGGLLLGGRGLRLRRRRRGSAAASPGVRRRSPAPAPPSGTVDGLEGTGGGVGTGVVVVVVSTGGRPFLTRSRALRSSRILFAATMKSCQMMRREGAALDRTALELGQHRLELVGIADPHGDGHALGEAHEPGVAGVLGRARLARGEDPVAERGARRRCPATRRST